MGVAVGPRFRTRFLTALHYIKRAQTIAQSLTRATVPLSTFDFQLKQTNNPQKLH